MTSISGLMYICINSRINVSIEIYRFRCRNVAGPALGLPGDPWLTPPGLLSALPGFLAAPHTGYPSYLTSPRRLPSPPNVGAVGSAVPGKIIILTIFSEIAIETYFGTYWTLLHSFWKIPKFSVLNSKQRHSVTWNRWSSNYVLPKSIQDLNFDTKISVCDARIRAFYTYHCVKFHRSAFVWNENVNSILPLIVFVTIYNDINRTPDTKEKWFSRLTGTLSGGMTSIGSGGHVAAAPPSPPGHDPRTTSIQALRMRAKEHVESITKGLQMVWSLTYDPGRQYEFKYRLAVAALLTPRAWREAKLPLSLRLDPSRTKKLSGNRQTDRQIRSSRPSFYGRWTTSWTGRFYPDVEAVLSVIEYAEEYKSE